MHGLILTNASSVDQLDAAVAMSRATALKVVTGWGLDGGWSNAARARVARLAPNLIVRTVAGDPSYANGAQSLPLAERIIDEVAPWYYLSGRTPALHIELGNEPNIDPATPDEAIWLYRWHLARAIAACRARLPHAKLIAPALLLDGADQHRQSRWLAICGDVFAQCDAVGVHVYEHDAFAAAERRHGTTGQVAEAARLYARFPRRIVTEYGINDPATPIATRARRCAAFARANALRADGYLLYHLCADGAVGSNYHLTPDALRLYGAQVTL